MAPEVALVVKPQACATSAMEFAPKKEHLGLLVPLADNVLVGERTLDFLKALKA